MSESRADVLRARVLRVAGIRAIEAAAQARHPSESLMERAGSAVASIALAMASERSGPIVVLVGPGNNGGDALVAARELHRRGCDVRVAVVGDSAAYRGDASTAWNAWQSVAGERTVDLRAVIDEATLIVDGLFGIGFSRAPAGLAREWIALVNASRCPVLAIDIPSGVDADTGKVVDIAIVADRTLTFLARKPGLQTGEGLDHCGDVVVDLLGIERDIDAEPHEENAHDIGTLNRPALFTHAWKPRRLNSHKGSYGSVAVVGGNHGMVGAALLAARMALHGGAGRVYVRLLADGGPGFDVEHPELMLRTTLDDIDADACAIGPGLGSDDAALAAIDAGLTTDAALVIDADALNAIASHPRLAEKLAARGTRDVPTTVLTPHPLEAARLLATDAATVQADRIGAATRLAGRTGCIVILKGAGSVIAEPSGGWAINPTGNPALATGGTGDVLCGLVAALIAQSLPPLAAARAATWIHGTAADELVAAGIGPVGMTASELIVAIRSVINRLRS